MSLPGLTVRRGPSGAAGGGPFRDPRTGWYSPRPRPRPPRSRYVATRLQPGRFVSELEWRCPTAIDHDHRHPTEEPGCARSASPSAPRRPDDRLPIPASARAAGAQPGGRSRTGDLNRLTLDHVPASPRPTARRRLRGVLPPFRPPRPSGARSAPREALLRGQLAEAAGLGHLSLRHH